MTIRGATKIDGLRVTHISIDCVGGEGSVEGWTTCDLELLMGYSTAGKATTELVGVASVDEAVRNLIAAIERHCASTVMVDVQQPPRIKAGPVFIGLGRSEDGGARVEDPE